MTSVDSLNAVGKPVTREEAIEISKNAELVREGMATFDYFGIGEINFCNSSLVKQLREGHNREIYENVPEGHDVWQVIWVFQASKTISVGYLIVVTVDAETGTILDERKGITL